MKYLRLPKLSMGPELVFAPIWRSARLHEGFVVRRPNYS
jgi:hypothetical protein